MGVALAAPIFLWVMAGIVYFQWELANHSYDHH